MERVYYFNPGACLTQIVLKRKVMFNNVPLITAHSPSPLPTSGAVLWISLSPEAMVTSLSCCQHFVKNVSLDFEDPLITLIHYSKIVDCDLRLARSRPDIYR